MDNLTDARILVEVDQELKPVVPQYLEKRLQDCTDIERLLVSGGMEYIQIMGHRMKGSGGSFGFDEISAIGEDLESAALTTDAERIRSVADRLEKYLKRVSVAYI
jgi:HPt (histidine-containing phosphotransfer) domain-containing protein